MLERLRVVATQTVTFITFAGVVATLLVAELAPFDNNPTMHWLIGALGVLVVVSGTAASIIRRVTPVAPSQRGILPPL